MHRPAVRGVRFRLGLPPRNGMPGADGGRGLPTVRRRRWAWRMGFRRFRTLDRSSALINCVLG
jgi:hypothetical protein